MDSTPVNLVISAPRPVKQAVMLAADIMLIPISIVLAFLLSSNFSLHAFNQNALLTIFTTMTFSVLIFIRLGLYHAVVRFMGNEALLAVVKAVSYSTILFTILIAINHPELPLTTPLIYFSLLMGLIGFTRLGARQLIAKQTAKDKINIAIYGAGSSGLALLASLRNSSKYNPVALVDDRPRIWNMHYHGLKVSAPEDLSMLVDQCAVQQILLAMPSITNERKRKIVLNLQSLGVRIRTVPSMESLVSGKAKLEQIQDISVEDLLRRQPVSPNSELMGKCITGKTVLVTGAGGSIGSELCRQIISQSPLRLILVERCEMALYRIDQELKQCISEAEASIPVIPLLACVQDFRRMTSIFESFNVETVYHTAAYKHVPLVEYNMLEGVRNNVFGTYETARAAQSARVSNFVLISTDKAVRPTNIMGASKRLAELVLQALTQENTGTRFCMVRFGNVLGSSGSVVPLFNKQISEGGPVTVTHPDVVRYFMTIAEASQLVIQAGAMASGGDVFLLDMGKPVKIRELAETMIRLLGLTVKSESNPDGDIEINYTGLRPGEKLFEELLVGRNVLKTKHAQIVRAKEQALSAVELSKLLGKLKRGLDNGNCLEIKEILLAANTGYNGDYDVSDLVWKMNNNHNSEQQSESQINDNIAYLSR